MTYSYQQAEESATVPLDFTYWSLLLKKKIASSMYDSTYA
jgi:hypothetical protein